MQQGRLRAGFGHPPHRIPPLARILTILSLIGLSLGWWGQDQAHATTPVSGHIAANTTWTKANHPYQVAGTLFVDLGVTLTIEPGVEVIFDENTSLQVDGTLVAEGSAGERIRFRGSTQQPGWWFGIHAGYDEVQPSSISLDYVTVEHAGYGGAVQVTVADAVIRHSVFQNNSHEGVNVALNRPLTLSDSSFLNNGLHGLRLTNSFTGNAFDPQLSNLTAAGNGNAGEGFNGVVYDAIQWDQGDHTLEPMGLPYVLNNGFTVEEGGRLIMAPGIEVQVDTGFYVYGALQAIGAANQPITITGIVKQPGGWWGLSASSADQASTVHLEHVILEYGGHTNSADGANLYASGSNVTVRNSTLRHAAGHGIFNTGGAPDDIFAVKIENAAFENNTGAAIVCDDESCKQTLGALTATGNGADAVVHRGGLWGNVTWTNTGLPYVVEGYSGIDDEGLMVIDPGVEIRMAQNAWFDVRGALYAVGTKDQPIVFTGTQQQPGWWQGMRISGTAELSYCDIGYGGAADNVPNSMIEISTNSALVSYCRLHHSANAAILAFVNATPIIVNNRIEDNAQGVVNQNGGADPLTVDARYNWWGSPSGPAHASNPGGQGDSVSDRVHFDPWLASPEDTTTATGLMVHVGGVGRYSPGDTVQYAIGYHNPTPGAVQDAVLRVALPANSTIVDSTNGGILWPDRRQVFWKLGTLNPGAGGLLAVRVTYAWGLPDGLKTAIVAQLGGSNVDQSLFNVGEYLAYQPRTETGVAALTAAQVQALRASDAKFGALYAQAEAGGYQFGDATERTYSSGEKLTQVILLRVVDADVQAFILWRLPGGSAGVALDGSTLTVHKPGQSAAFNLQTKTWQNLAGGQVAAASIGWSDCMINCIEDKLPGEVAEQLIKAYSVGKKAVGCVKAAGGDQDGILECSKVIDKVIPVYGLGVELVTCNNDCDECVANGQGCDDDKCHCCTQDKYRCSSDDWLYGTFGIDVVLVRECSDGMYLAEKVIKTCALCDKCIMSGSGAVCVSKNALASQADPEEAAALEAALEPARADLTLVNGGSDQECEECRKAKDPNEITGPTGDLLPGQWVTYTVEYENVGEGVAYDVFVVNPLSEHFDLSTLAMEGAPPIYSLSLGARRLFVIAGDLQPKGQNGSKGQFTYRVKLKDGLTSGTVIANQAVVHFPSVPEETPTNTAVNTIQPIAVPDQKWQVQAGQAKAITLAGQDAAGAPLTFAVAGSPLYGTLAGSPPALTYTPQPGFAGIDRIFFTASNGVVTSRQAQVVIEVLSAGNDQTRPTVKWTSPANGAMVGSSPQVAWSQGGALYAPYIQIQFSEPMEVSTVNTGAVEVQNGVGQIVPIVVQYDPTLDQAVALLQQQGVSGATYSVTVKGGVTDLARNALGSDHKWTFRFGDFDADMQTVFLPFVGKR